MKRTYFITVLVNIFVFNGLVLGFTFQTMTESSFVSAQMDTATVNGTPDRLMDILQSILIDCLKIVKEEDF